VPAFFLFTGFLGFVIAMFTDHERSGAKRSELVLACERKRASKLNNSKQASNTASNNKQSKQNNKQATSKQQQQQANSNRHSRQTNKQATAKQHSKQATSKKTKSGKQDNGQQARETARQWQQ
jgi:hypothetical protein